MKKHRTSAWTFHRLWKSLGPGVVTGAADDDPASIATFSVSGAQFGYQFAWSALVTWPMMACVQMMAARIGMVSGEGLAGAFRNKFPKWVMVVFALALLVANTINIASDLAAMGDAASMLGAGPRLLWVGLFALGICIAAARFRYRTIATVLQWLALSLLAYVVTAFAVQMDWAAVAHATFVPALPRDSEGWATLVAILGATISPFLYFWQAGQEIEEKTARGRSTRAARANASAASIQDRRLDVGAGTLFSNLIMFFIIITCAATLHAAGHTRIETTREAAEALKPFAGAFAYWLFSAALVATGLLTIPTLAGSAAYALAETFGWKFGLDKGFKEAKAFYVAFFIAAGAAVVIDFVGIDPIKALFWSAVINGLLAPPLLFCMVLVARDRRIMHAQPSPASASAIVLVTAVVMTAAGIAMFVV